MIIIRTKEDDKYTHFVIPSVSIRSVSQRLCGQRSAQDCVT